MPTDLKSMLTAADSHDTLVGIEYRRPILSPIVQRAADNARGYTAYHAGCYYRREFPQRPNPWPSWSIEHREWQSGWADEDRALDTQKWARVCPVFRFLTGTPR